MQYFVTPTHDIAVNYRAGSTSLAKALVTTFYPERMDGVNNLLPEEERFADPHIFKVLAPMTESPDRPILMLVRDPVERFLSMLSLTGHEDVRGALADQELMAGEHFCRQADYEPDEVFRFPDEIEAFCAEAGLPYPLPELHEGGPKREITAEERAAIEEYYADDVKLFGK